MRQQVAAAQQFAAAAAENFFCHRQEIAPLTLYMGPAVRATQRFSVSALVIEGTMSGGVTLMTRLLNTARKESIIIYFFCLFL